jgi:hypothetical protein
VSNLAWTYTRQHKKRRQEIANESRAIRWPWVRSAVAEESRDLLNLNVVDVLLDTWKKYMQIEQYGDPKEHTPQEKIFAPLANHTVKSEHHPCVKILLKGKEVGSIEFSLEFSLTLESFVLVIQNGKVMEIQTGLGKGEGSLALVETELWKQELTLVHFPGSISLGSGFPCEAKVYRLRRLREVEPLCSAARRRLRTPEVAETHSTWHKGGRSGKRGHYVVQQRFD